MKYKNTDMKKVTHKDIGLDNSTYLDESEKINDDFDLESDIWIFREIGATLVITLTSLAILYIAITR